MTPATSAIESIVVTALPFIPALVSDIIALFKKYPQLSAAQIAAFVQASTTQADAAANDTLATIAADQAKA